VEVESNFESQWKWNGIESKLVEVESNWNFNNFKD
jgi:hypothetical protein